MPTKITLTRFKNETTYAPLGVLGYCLTRTGYLSPIFTELALTQKTVDHAPADKLLDVIVSILAGCRSLTQVNTRLRPDLALAQAWGRKRFAEQSTLARTLDAFTDVQLEQLRQGSETLFRRESRTLKHDYTQDWLWLDIDLTPLPASKHAQASSKGNLGKKIVMVGNLPGCMRLSIKKPSFRTCIREAPPVFRPTFPSFVVWISS